MIVRTQPPQGVLVRDAAQGDDLLDAGGEGQADLARHDRQPPSERFARIRLDRPVVDGTGLEGRFDVEYSYATASDIAAGIAGNLPLLVVALEEQLGLKLDPQRTMVPVLVIDSVERLIEN